MLQNHKVEFSIEFSLNLASEMERLAWAVAARMSAGSLIAKSVGISLAPGDRRLSAEIGACAWLWRVLAGPPRTLRG
jgi:hypothetical protein